MAFREKILWVSMIAVVVIWGSYFFDLLSVLVHRRVDVDQAYGGFVKSVVLLVTVEIVAAIVLALVSPKDADAPADAREREFAASAARWAYPVLSTLVVVTMLAIPVIVNGAPRFFQGDPATVNAIVIGNALLCALVLSELVHSGWQIVRYRRGG